MSWPILFVAESPALALCLAHSWPISICSEPFGEKNDTKQLILIFSEFNSRIEEPDWEKCGGSGSVEEVRMLE